MLVLPIKKKWFDMIKSGVKPEEYRAFNMYYYARFSKLFKLMYTDKQEIMFRNGYLGTSPSFIATCTLECREGNEAWGAVKGETYYVLVIHGIKEN